MGKLCYAGKTRHQIEMNCLSLREAAEPSANFAYRMTIGAEHADVGDELRKTLAHSILYETHCVLVSYRI
jgi:hypothetical protein